MTDPLAGVDGGHGDGGDRRIVLERETKLAATPSFRLPALGDGMEGMETVPAPPQQLSTTYFDTDDHRLARWGASLRRRTVEGWTVKLPVEADGQVLARRTLRRRTELRDPQGRVLAELIDDEVSVLDGRRIAMRLRELEVAAADGTPPGLLGQVAARLRQAGAGAPEGTPRAARALGPRATGPPTSRCPRSHSAPRPATSSAGRSPPPYCG